MTLTELSTKYFVIQTIERNSKKIAVCKDKATSLYVFFEENFGSFFPVDTITEFQLKKIYKSSVPTEFFINNTMQNEEFVKLINDIMPKCKATIFYALNGMPNDIIKQCYNNLKGLKIVSGDIGVQNAPAAYLPVEHKIKIGQVCNNRYTFQYYLVHEILHATTRYDESLTGVTKLICLSSNDSLITNTAIGVGINEAITDYVAYEKMKEYLKNNNIDDAYSREFLDTTHDVTSYDSIVNIFKTLAEQIDMQTCLEYYYNSNLDGLLDYVSQKYHLDNHDKFLSLVYKMDTFVDLLQVPDYPDRNKDVRSIISEMYKDTIDLVLYKNLKEGKDISTFKFEDIITNYRLALPTKQQFDAYFDSLKFYFYLKTSNKEFNIAHFNMQEDALEMCQMLLNASRGIDYYLHQKHLTPEFFARMFSKSFYINEITNLDADPQEFAKHIQISAFSTIFNGNRQSYFYNNPKSKNEILLGLMQNKAFLAFDFYSIISNNTLGQLVNHKPRIIKNFIKDTPEKLESILTYVDTNVKLSERFIKIIKDKAKFFSENNKPYMPLLKAYYRSFPLDIRATNKFSGELCVYIYNNLLNGDYDNQEVKDFVAEIKSDHDKYTAQQNEIIYK